MHDICQACGRNMMVLINWRILQDKRLLHFVHAIRYGHSLTGDIFLYQQGSDPKLQTVQEI